MGPYLQSVYNVMLDRPPEDWIEGIMIALFLALALTGIHSLCRRWIKATDETMLLVGPAIVVIFAGMVLTAGFIAMKVKGAVGPTDPSRPRGRPFRGPDGFSFSSRLANLIFETADADHDGRLSTDEAVTAADQFVKQASVNGEGTLDRDALIAALRDRMRSSGGPPPAPMPPPPASPPPAETREPRRHGDTEDYKPQMNTDKHR